MKLPRHAEIWLAPYLRDRLRTRLRPAPKRVWLAIGDHYEPYWHNTDDALATSRVQLWRKQWPQIAARCPRDSAGRSPRYTFFYPEEEYRPHLMDMLAEMTEAGVGDVEVHIHHDGEGEQKFVDRMSGFTQALNSRHGLLRKREGKIAFGFIHGNWALDNSRPDGRWCGLNNEITLLRDLGCYADFTMPSGNSPTQASTINEIYWAKDDPAKPKSYDRGVPLRPGEAPAGDLLMIPGPFGLRWQGRLVPRLEAGELASYDPPSLYRIRRWLDLAPRIGGDLFIKLYSHGTQERNSSMLLNGGLENLYKHVAEECSRRSLSFYFVSTWEMFSAVEALRQQQDPTAVVSKVLWKAQA